MQIAFYCSVILLFCFMGFVFEGEASMSRKEEEKRRNSRP